MKKNKNHLVIDCSSLIYAAFYTTGTLSYDGKPTGVIYGFLRKTLSIAKKLETKHVYFAWDHPTNFRKDIYPVYKANRVKNLTSEEIEDHKRKDTQAVELRHSVLKKLGFRNHFQQRGYEADDMMARVAEILKGKKVILITSDADMYQCLDYCDIINPVTMKRMTSEIFKQEYRVDPSQWPVCKSIGGCQGDNVIGIQGVSDPKNKSSKALNYIRGEISSGVIYDRIVSDEGQQIIARNLPIVTCPYMPKKMKPMRIRKDKVTREKLVNVFSQYDFRSFLKPENLKTWFDIFLD